MTWRMLLLPLAALAWAAHAAPAAPAAQAATTWPLAAAPGDYFEGAVALGSRRVDLDLLDAQGRPLRRLLAGAGGQAAFRFVVEPGFGTGLSLRASAALDAAPQLRRVPVDQQRPPAPAYRSPALAALAREPARLEAFWQRLQREGTPLVEPLDGQRRLMTFVWRGAQRNVRLFGGPSNDHEWLERLPATDVWFKTFEVPAGTRLSYQLAPDVPELPGNERERRVALLATAQADPLNRHPWPADAVDRFARQSTVALAMAPDQPGSEPGREPGQGAAASGTLSQFDLHSAGLGNTRRITVYRPPGFDPRRPDNLLLFVFDADEYLHRIHTPAILEHLQAQGRLPPVVAVFIANPDREARGRELPGHAPFADFMATELLPRVLAETGLKPNPARTVLAGSSYGGLASATVALRHPDRFGNVLSLSGSFWWHPPEAAADRPHHVAQQLLAAPQQLPLRFFLAAGLFETARPGSDGILETNRHLRDVLEAKGYPVTLREYAAGHDYLAWRGALADGLLSLFGRPAAPAPQPVVALDLAVLDSLDALGVPVAGVPGWAMPPALARYNQPGYAKLGTLFEPDEAAIRALKPGLILAGARLQDQQARLAALAPTRLVTPQAADFEASVVRNARELGRLFGREAEVETRLGRWTGSLAQIRQRAAGAGRVLVLMTAGGKLYHHGPGSRFGTLHAIYGLEPADPRLQTSSRGREISPAELQALDADWLMVIDRDAATATPGPSAGQLLLAAGVPSTRAGRAGRVLMLDPVALYLTQGGLASEQRLADQLLGALPAP